MASNTPQPIFTIQTASLFASGDASTFTGTGGPSAFDPFLAGFYDTVSSAGIAGEPFDDEVYDVDAGDQVTFVIAIQNFGAVPGYNLKVRDTVPVGFALSGAGLSVTDGNGNPLIYSGLLFDSSGGLVISPPVAAYSDSSGANVVLITFTATATNSVALPGATVSNTAQIVSFAASNGGANIAGSNSAPLTVATPVQTGTLAVSSVADQAATPLLTNHTASFDITVALPEGTVPDLRIDEILPQTGTAWLNLVSVQVVSVGGHLTTAAPAIVQADGSVHLGNVVDTADNLITADDNVVLRVTVQGAGTTAGTGTLQTVVSTADPNGGTTRPTQTVTNTVSLATPDNLPTIAGASNAQFATSSALVLPFNTLQLADADTTQVQTLTIHLSDPSLGTLSGVAGLTANAAGDAVLTGTVATVQALVRSLLFTPSANAVGTETFGLTLDDGAGGIATSQARLTLAADAHPSSLVQFPISSQTVLTSTATGSSTISQVETYQGAISNIGTQYLYSGDTTLAIVAQQAGMLISSQAPQTAVQLLGGSNVIDMRAGSAFLVGATGSGSADTVLLHVDQPQVTWNTVANFHAGDSIILYGFTAGTSADWWDASAGAAGYTGPTLRIDADGNGSIDSSLTFAGKTMADIAHFSLQTGNVGGQNFLSVTTT